MATMAHAPPKPIFRYAPGFPIGPKETRIVKNQQLTYLPDRGLLMQTTTEILDVPAGSYFTVDDLWVVRPRSRGVGVDVDIHFGVNFSKFSPLKSIITSNSNAETTKWFQNWYQRALSLVG